MNTLNEAMLSEYNFIVAIDRSGSMGSLGRWEAAKEVCLSVANFAGKVDFDGIDIITFGAGIEAFEKQTADKISELFRTIGPNGSTPLNEALVKANEIRIQSNKKAFVIVVTDGAPDDEKACAATLTAISNSLNQDNDCTFLFIQIDDDKGATQFLAGLDDNLKGAKFDIVDKKTVEEFKSLGFEALFTIAQND